jgi:DNA-binding transcriptional regulator YdaS (Cro superfamily)
MSGIQDETPALALADAIRAANGLTGLARALEKITPQAICQWRITPALRVLEVERVTGVSRHRLRPDLYPIEDAASQQS